MMKKHPDFIYRGQNRIHFSVILLMTITFLLAGCASPTETDTPAAASPTETEVVVTLTLPPTATATEMPPTPTATPVNYFDLSPEEKLARSEELVEQANSYSGEITFNMFNWTGKGDYADFDCPVYWSASLGEWKTVDTCSAGGLPKADLDLYGDTLPEVAAAGWENDDGSLVFVHPQTGEEIIFPGIVSVPGIGEISMRDLMAMDPEELNRIMSEFTAGAILERTGDPELQLYKMQQFMAIRGTAYPGYVVSTARLFPAIAAIGGEDFPELQVDVIERLTDFVAMPIFSPETGDFMFWLTIQKGRLGSVLNFDGADYDIVRGGDPKEFLGTNGSTFGVFMEYFGDDHYLAYHRGGGGSQILNLDGDDPGIGNIDLVMQVWNAPTEQDVISLLGKVGIIFTYPSVVIFEAGQ